MYADNRHRGSTNEHQQHTAAAGQWWQQVQLQSQTRVGECEWTNMNANRQTRMQTGECERGWANVRGGAGEREQEWVNKNGQTGAGKQEWANRTG